MRSIILITLILFLAGCAYSSEQEVIASVIAAEACGEGVEGMELVAEVIRNRSLAWGLSPYQVVTAKNQFYGYTASNRAKLYHSCQREADNLALRLLEGSLGHKTRGALYFLRPGERLRAWHGVKTITYKRHTFYKGK